MKHHQRPKRKNTCAIRPIYIRREHLGDSGSREGSVCVGTVAITTTGCGGAGSVGRPRGTVLVGLGLLDLAVQPQYTHEGVNVIGGARDALDAMGMARSSGGVGELGTIGVVAEGASHQAILASSNRQTEAAVVAVVDLLNDHLVEGRVRCTHTLLEVLTTAVDIPVSGDQLLLVLSILGGGIDMPAASTNVVVGDAGALRLEELLHRGLVVGTIRSEGVAVDARRGIGGGTTLAAGGSTVGIRRGGGLPHVEGVKGARGALANGLLEQALGVALVHGDGVRAITDGQGTAGAQDSGGVLAGESLLGVVVAGHIWLL